MADNRSPANPAGTYNVRALREDILAARSKGATDEDLLKELAADPVLGPKVQKMLAAGVSPSQAIDNVAVITKPEKYDPTEGMSTLEKGVAGIGMSFDKAGRGIRQVVGGLLPDALVKRETKERWAAENAQADRENAPLRATGAGTAGEIFGDLITTAAPGMGATAGVLRMIPRLAQAGKLATAARASRALAGAAAGGVGTQAVTPESEVLDSAGSYGEKAAKGAAEGVVGDVAARGVGRLLKPLRFSIPQEHLDRLNRLRSYGVGGDTPANAGRGAFDLAQLTGDQTAIDLKSSLSKLPLVSSSMEKHANAQLGDVTQAAMARTGLPEARTVTQEALSGAKGLLNKRNAEFGNMGPAKLDPEYIKATDAVRKENALSAALTGAGPDLFKSLDAASRVARGARSTIPMKDALRIRGDLSDAAHDAYMSGTRLQQKVLGGAQQNLDDAVRRSMEAQSPGSGEAWDLYRRQRGNLLDVSAAAGAPGGRGPGDTLNPKALANVLRSGEGRGRFATGEGSELTTLADDASRVIVDQVPNSGTPQRSLYSMMLLGGLPALGSAGAAGGAYASDDNRVLGGALGTLAGLAAGPMLAKHAMTGKGLFGAKHLAMGVPGADNVNDAMKKLGPAFTAALIERLRQKGEGEQ